MKILQDDLQDYKDTSAPSSNARENGDKTIGCSCCRKFQEAVLGGLQTAFYRYGNIVARYPFFFILACLVLTGCLATGFLVWKEESDGTKIWQPQDSTYVKNRLWLRENYPPTTRFSTVLITADNVLDPTVMGDLLALYKKIAAISYPGNSSLSFWKKVCEKLPGEFDQDMCTEFSILELFVDKETSEYDESQISSLTNEQIVEMMNTQQTSGRTGKAFQPERFLGSRQYDDKGRLVEAQAMTMHFIGQAGNLTDEAMDFEMELITTVNNFNFSEGVKAYPFTRRSFSDLVGKTVYSDLDILTSGYVLIFIYVCFALGRRNRLEHRVWLSVLGILSIGLSIISSYGLSQLIGFFFTPMHGILPFLLLGVGVDNMFVIMQAFENLDEEERMKVLCERIAATMEHAGVAITITSVTDFLAFLIGATTVIPALSSFCIYAGLGIIFIYFYQITFFVAWFTYDLKRVEANRDGCWFCCQRVPADWKPSNCSQVDILKRVFEFLADNIVLRLGGQVVIILASMAMLAVGVWGILTLETNFNYSLWVDEGTYLRKYMDEMAVHFPENGNRANIYMVDTDFPADLAKLEMLERDLRRLEEPNAVVLPTGTQRNILRPHSVESWITPFINFTDERRAGKNLSSVTVDPEYSQDTFKVDLAMFLYSKAGKEYVKHFMFDPPIPRHGFPSKDTVVRVSTISYDHVAFPKSLDGIEAMKTIFDLVDKYEFTSPGNVFASGDNYGSLITTDIITVELVRNVSISLGVVFLVILFLIANVAMALVVLATVLITVVNVAGYANFWGLDVDTVFTIFLTISIGLCVDYSAHMAHSFMAEKGSRRQRTRNCMVKIGPAVFNGGFSTFVAFVLLCTSTSNAFLTFFKIFFLVVTFGLFHGLILLPVVLCLVGPSDADSRSAYQQEVTNNKKDDGDTGAAMDGIDHSGASVRPVVDDSKRYVWTEDSTPLPPTGNSGHINGGYDFSSGSDYDTESTATFHSAGSSHAGCSSPPANTDSRALTTGVQSGRGASRRGKRTTGLDSSDPSGVAVGPAPEKEGSLRMIERVLPHQPSAQRLPDIFIDETTGKITLKVINQTICV